MSNRFLTANGTPASGPSGLPRARFVERTRTIVRTLFGQSGERIEQWIARANANERCLDKLQGAYTASRDFGGEVARFGPGPVIRRQRIKHKTPTPA